MKLLGETNALEKLHNLKRVFAATIGAEYEHRAKDCASCENNGACCLDAHFVNVRITRLEARAIRNVLYGLSLSMQRGIRRRIAVVIEKYQLADGCGESAARTFACPLFEPGIGCLVHHDAKPLPCINHACYENEGDLPPNDMLDDAEARVERLNRRVYGRQAIHLRPLPLAIADELRNAAKNENGESGPPFD